MIATEGISYGHAGFIVNISGKWTASGSNSGEQKCAEGATFEKGESLRLVTEDNGTRCCCPLFYAVVRKYFFAKPVAKYM